jgi:hypothetical protein
MRRAWFAIFIGVLAACGAQRVDAPSPLAGDAATTGDSVVAEQSEVGDPRLSDLALVKVGSIDQPVDAASRVGDAAVYFVSRGGTIHRFIDGAFEATPVLDISDLTDGDGERGLLGLAFSLTGDMAFVNYTDANGDTTVASLPVDGAGQFDRNSMRTLLSIEQPFRNHNAGDVVIEPSGTLLIPMGDGGSADDPLRVSLDDRSLLGKVVRLDPRDGSTSVIAKGLRNPWRVDLFGDRLWLADVGQNKWEEVSVLDAVSSRIGTRLGESTSSAAWDVVDFGWSAYEANTRFNDDQSSRNHVPPVVAYEHGDNGCSISGGAVAVRGALQGRYVFADYCSGRVWSIAADESSPAMQLHFADIDTPAAVVRANDEIYVLALSGTIWRING